MVYLKKIFISILSMSTIASVLFLLILLARKLIKNKYSVGKYSLLWIIFIITLIVPLNFKSRLSIKNLININEKMYTLNSYDTFYVEDTDILNDTYDFGISKYEKVDYLEILSFIWFSIVITLTLKDLYVYNTINKINKTSKIPKKILKIYMKSKQKLNIKKDIELVIQDKIKVPSLIRNI